MKGKDNFSVDGRFFLFWGLEVPPTSENLFCWLSKAHCSLFFCFFSPKKVGLVEALPLHTLRILSVLWCLQLLADQAAEASVWHFDVLVMCSLGLFEILVGFGGCFSHFLLALFEFLLAFLG